MAVGTEEIVDMEVNTSAIPRPEKTIEPHPNIDVEVKLNIPATPPLLLERLTNAARADAKLIKIYAELVDQGKSLPGVYSNFSPEQLRDLIQTPSKEAYVGGETETQTPSSDVDFERERILEAVELGEEHKRDTAVIHSLEEATNPLGEVKGNVSLVVLGDLHHAPSDPEERTHEEALAGYFPFRTAQNIQDKFIQRKHFSGVKGEISPTKENVHIRWIIKETARHMFFEWLTDVVEKGDYSPESQDSTPIMVTMGDIVHAGAIFGDQVSVSSDLRLLLDEIESRRPDLKPKLLEIYGNHDEDSRLPDSFAMLNELYGHRIYTQEVDGNVMIAALDTNIENPGFIHEFNKRADPIALEALKIRQELQAQVKEKIQKHDGAVLIIGHHPGQLVDKLAVETDILQSSNVQAILAAHTHTESHHELPFRNKRGEKIVIHTLESIISMEGEVPKSPKAYSLDIRDGKVGPMRTLQRPQDRFKKDYEYRISA